MVVARGEMHYSPMGICNRQTILGRSVAIILIIFVGVARNLSVP